MFIGKNKIILDIEVLFFCLTYCALFLNDCLFCWEQKLLIQTYEACVHINMLNMLNFMLLFRCKIKSFVVHHEFLVLFFLTVLLNAASVEI